MSDTQKQNKPNVPNLRFPEFSGEWIKYILGDLVDFAKDRISSSNLNEENYVSTENMLQNFQGVVKAQSVPSNTNVITYKNGNVLMSNIRPYLKKVWMADRDGGCSSDVFVMQANRHLCDEDFLHYIIANERFITYVMSGVKGVKMPRGDKQQMKGYGLSIPSLKEQQHIARFITLLDNRIAIQNKVIEKYESLIKAITQQAQKKATKCYYLREVLTERKELNSKGFDICSVSVSKGVINQVEYLGRSFAAKETTHYHVVRHGDIVYTKSPTGDFPYGIIKQSYSENPVAVSPLYGVYEPITYEVGVFLHHYFCSSGNALNYLHPLIQKGAKNTINITNQHFLDNQVRIPDSGVLSSTISAITTITFRLQLEEQLLRQLELQKQFALSNMFI